MTLPPSCIEPPQSDSSHVEPRPTSRSTSKPIFTGLLARPLLFLLRQCNVGGTFINRTVAEIYLNP